MATNWKNIGRVGHANRVLGDNDANNDFDSSSVVGNLDGSILERLEAMMGGLPASFIPTLGFRVTKTEDGSVATGDDLFTLTGKVLITLWTAEVTNALGATAKFSDYQIRLTTLAGVLIAAGDISSSIVGHMFTLNGDAGDTALSTSSSAVSVGGVGDTQGKMGQLVVGKAGGTDIIKSVRTAGDAGDALIHIVYYWPLEAGASLVAAA